ncbi:TetR/AcrR family transcriptional regulator [Inquilinus limosus]|uniref:TetR family transcriptional regulator n=1 Tax=Inquilinus limosus TaxID=171674 RepID=A0A211ZE47_9PROT|nr:TetR/AcrR family transcriptional regulator [Inquilinus limosus]OWJ63531.1 TetR family transcriptional regulator [Inquilinus limosus]
MDNATRSERSRAAAIQAALAIIARDGPGRLTLDAIARESGISKGGVMHHFRTKDAVVKALLEHLTERFGKFTQEYLAGIGPDKPGAVLEAQIATLRESIATPHSAFFAILGAVAENPDLLSINREAEAEALEAVKAEAADPDLAVLRWMAARGLHLTTLLGTCPLTAEERDRLFDRLLDETRWSAADKPAPARPSRGRKNADV